MKERGITKYQQGYSLVEIMFSIGIFSIFLYGLNHLNFEAIKMKRSEKDFQTFLQLDYELEMELAKTDFLKGCSGALAGQNPNSDITLDFIEGKGLLANLIETGAIIEGVKITSLSLELEDMGVRPYLRNATLKIEAATTNNFLSRKKIMKSDYEIVIFLNPSNLNEIQKCGMVNTAAAECLGMVSEETGCEHGFFPNDLTFINEYGDNFICMRYGVDVDFCRHTNPSAQVAVDYMNTISIK